MKVQFGTRTLLIATAFIGLWVGASTALPSVLRLALGLPSDDTVWVNSYETMAIYLGMTAPLSAPIAIVGYGLGRTSLTVRMAIAAGVAEALALAIAAGAER